MGAQPPRGNTEHISSPVTFREISEKALESLPKLCQDNDLTAIGVNRSALIVLISEKLLRVTAKGLREQYDLSGIDSPLDEDVLQRLRNDKTGVNKILREVAGQVRRPKMEEEARRILRTEAKASGIMPPEEAEAAVDMIDPATRLTLSQASTRTLEECVDKLLARCRAYLSRTRGVQVAWQPSVPESDALRTGQLVHDAFSRAMEPVIADAGTFEIVGHVLLGLGELEQKVKAPEALSSQLATKALLEAGQDEQLRAEVRLRAHFPFGLVLHSSHATLAAALYLLQAQASDSVIRSSTQDRPHREGPRQLYIHTRNTVAKGMYDKTARDSVNGWHTQYPATPGILDCLRAAVAALTQDQVPIFTGITPRTQLAPDAACALISAALPLDESTHGEGTISWTRARVWNPVGNRLLQKVNREHYSVKARRYFNEAAFEGTVTKTIEHVLEELVKRLQRVEGLTFGLPNDNSPYDGRSLLSLNRFLYTIWSTASGSMFGQYQKTISTINSTPARPSRKPAATDSAPLANLPSGLALLTSSSVRLSLERLVTTTEPYEWTSDTLSSTYELSADETRAAALDSIQFIDWAIWHETQIKDQDLNEMTEAFRLDGDFNDQAPGSYRTNLLKAMLIDTMLADETTRSILSNRAGTVEAARPVAKPTEDTTP